MVLEVRSKRQSGPVQRGRCDVLLNVLEKTDGICRVYILKCENSYQKIGLYCFQAIIICIVLEILLYIISFDPWNPLLGNHYLYFILEETKIQKDCSTLKASGEALRCLSLCDSNICLFFPCVLIAHCPPKLYVPCHKFKHMKLG